MEGCLGEESFQLWELNRRLEAYLTRVKALEEQNELLSAELGGLRAQSGDTSWRARADDELATLRALVDQRWREKHAAELERDNLAEELEGVAGRCQQLRRARERTAEEAAGSRRAVEAEKRARDWLSAQVAELERELEALRAAHEEDRAHLNAQAASAPRGPPAPRAGPPAPAPEVEELARRLGEAWRGAVHGYQERVEHMQRSLGEARERLGRAVQGAREGRLELQQLQAERSGLQERRAALEQRLEGCWQERLRATEKFQLAVEALEQEKQDLQSQIAQVLESRQQLAHLKMSLSLEVATYRTLLEAENSRLQTPGNSSQAPLGFQDPKLQLHFPGTPEGRRLGPVMSVLSPTPLPSPLPNTLETPVPTFLKSQEFLQASTPTLASTPILPTPQTPCPATNVEVRDQGAPLSLLQTYGGGQQAKEPLWSEAKVAVPVGIGPGLEEPGSKQSEASTGQSPKDQAFSGPPLNPDHPILAAKDEEPKGSKVSSIFQEEYEEQIWGLAEKEAVVEDQVGKSSGQDTPDRESQDTGDAQDSQGPAEKETLKTLGEENQEPLMSLEIQSHETQRKENCNSLRSEEGGLETLKSQEKEKQLFLESLEEQDMEAEKTLEKELPELLTPLRKEDPQTLHFLQKNQGLMMSPAGTLETALFLGKEHQEAGRAPEEENAESLAALKNESQWPLGSKGAEDQEAQKSLAKDEKFLSSLENGTENNFRPLERGDQESLRSLENEGQRMEPSETENQESLQCLEENHSTLEPVKKETLEPLTSLKEEDQESSRSLEDDQSILKPLEKEDQESLSSLEDENQETFKLLETENQEPSRSLEDDQSILKPLEKEDQESLSSLEDENQETFKLLETENQEPSRSLGDDQSILKPLEQDQESLESLEDENQETFRPLETENQEPSRSLGDDQSILKPLEEQDQESLRSLEDEKNQETFRPPETENQEQLKSLEEEDQPIGNLLEKESQESLSSLEDGNKETFKLLEKEDLDSLRTLEAEDQMTERSLEIEKQELLRSLGDGNQETFRSLEHQESLRFLEKKDQEIQRSLEQETQQPPGAVVEDQISLKPSEKVNSELNQSLRKDQKLASSLEQGNQELLISLKEGSTEIVRSLEAENLEPLKTAEDMEITKSLEAEEPLWSLEEMTPLRNENQEPLGCVDENQETQRLLKKGTQERSLGEWNLKAAPSPESTEGESQQDPEVEESLDMRESQDSLTALERQELPQIVNQLRWQDTMAESQELGRDLIQERTEAESLGQVEPHLSTKGGQEEVSQPGEVKLDAIGEAWSLEDPESKEQRVLAEEANRKHAEEFQNPQEQSKQAGASDLQAAPGTLEVTEPLLEDESVAQEDEQELLLGSETVGDQSAAGAGPGLEQEVTGLGDPEHLAGEKVMQLPLGGESLQAKGTQGLGEHGKDLGAEPSELPGTRGESLEPPQVWEAAELAAHWGAEKVLPGDAASHEGGSAALARSKEDEDAHLAQGPSGSGFTEPCPTTPVIDDVTGPQVQAEGGEEAGWGVESRPEVLGRVEGKEEFSPGESLEVPQEGEESREESEADELGETLPDSTPLGLYLGSPNSPKWDLTGEQRPSPQGEAKKEGWDPAVPLSEKNEKEEEEKEKEEEEEEEAKDIVEEQGHDSEFSEEFEDLGTEASLLPGVPREVAAPLGQAPALLEPACWHQGGESDGFADEEESAEEGEEEEEEDEEGVQPGARWWGPDPSQRGALLEPEAAGISGPWDGGLRDAMTGASVALETTESQNSTEPSGSEESDSVSLEREDRSREPGGVGPGTEDNWDVSGRSLNVEESMHVNGRVVNGLEQSEGVEQGKQMTPDGDPNQGLTFLEEEGSILKTPWVGSTVHLGPSQHLKFSPREADGDSWSSGED